MLTVRKAIFIVVMIVSILVIAAPTSNYLMAQEPTATATAEVPPTPTPLPTPTAFAMQALGFTLIGHADIQVDTDGQILASASTLALPPGTASLTFTVAGPTVIMVQTGDIFISSDNAEISFVDTSAVVGIYPTGGSPGPVDTLQVTTGQQVVLPAGATCLIRNDSAVAATVLILSISSVPGQ